MRRIGRYAFAGLAWLFVVGVVVQVFFAGMGLFNFPRDMSSHVGFGYLISYVPLLMLVATVFARPDRRTVLMTLLLVLFGAIIQPILPWFRTGAPVVAALHPPNALLVFWLAVIVGRRSMALLSGERQSGAAAGVEGAAPVQ